jgi:hypothetical protein
MAITYRVHVVEGARRGDKVKLRRGSSLIFGRGKEVFDLMDPMVATRHCAIVWDDDGFALEDLGSPNGTFIEGVDIGDRPVALRDGVSFVAGETVLRFQEERSLLPQWVYWVALIALIVTFPAFLQLVVDWRMWDRMTPYLEAPNTVTGAFGVYGDGTGQMVNVPIDRCLAREWGTKGSDLRIRRVSDWDDDGISELWVEGPRWERLYTFDARGEWLLMGEFPLGCQNAPGEGFRDLRCGNQTYRFRHGLPLWVGEDRCARGSNKGHYDLVSVDGVAVWVSEPNDHRIPTAHPYQMGLHAKRELATWLGERGIDTPIHFLVCEDFYPGMSAQFMTSNGHIERMKPGCVNTVDIGGGRAGQYASRPTAIAFTETGRRLLIEQLAVYLGGSTDGHFQSPSAARWWAEAATTPTWHSASFVTFQPSPTASARVFDPIAPERVTMEVQPFNRLVGQNVPGRLRAVDWRWSTGGTVLQTPCGRYVRIEPSGWRCGPPCLRGTTFLSVSQVNGPQWSLTYQDLHRRVLVGEDVEISVSVVAGPAGYVPQAMAASVAVRDTQVCDHDPEVEGPRTRHLED